MLDLRRRDDRYKRTDREKTEKLGKYVEKSRTFDDDFIEIFSFSIY